MTFPKRCLFFSKIGYLESLPNLLPLEEERYIPSLELTKQRKLIFFPFWRHISFLFIANKKASLYLQNHRYFLELLFADKQENWGIHFARHLLSGDVANISNKPLGSDNSKTFLKPEYLF
jgi:hypothetical protein